MRHFLILISVIGLITCQFLGCSEDTEPEGTVLAPIESNTDTPNVLPPAPPEEEVLEEGLLTVMWNELGWHFDGQSQLDALRAVTTSQTYLDYLAETYPTEEPVESLEEYFQIAAPDLERYIRFLRRWTDAPTDEDIAVVHKMNNVYRECNFILATTNDDKAVVEIHLMFKKLKVMVDLGVNDVNDFRQRHDIPAGEDLRAFEELAAETAEIDATWLDEQMDTFGLERGLLWSALQRPALIGEIFLYFPSTDLFLAWVETERAR